MLDCTSCYLLVVGGVAALVAIIMFQLPSRFKAWMRSRRATALAKRALNYVLENAESGNPDLALAAMDTFCTENNASMMHVGPEKGRIVDKALADAKPKVALELGAYCGYSAVRMGRLLKAGEGRLISLEINPDYVNIARAFINFAGLDDRVEVLLGSSEKLIPQLKDRCGVTHVDFVFIDHWKDIYLRDLKLLEKNNLLRPGSVVVGDNILYPGAPEFKAHMLASPNYKTVIHPSRIPYSNEDDEVLVAEFLG